MNGEKMVPNVPTSTGNSAPRPAGDEWQMWYGKQTPFFNDKDEVRFIYRNNTINFYDMKENEDAYRIM